MRIKFTKTGLFSIHPVNGPVVRCTADEYAELPDGHADVLIDNSWAVLPDKERTEKQEQHPSWDEVKTRYPWEMDVWKDKKRSEKKDILVEYASMVYGAKIDKRQSVKKMIDEIKDREIESLR